MPRVIQPGGGGGKMRVRYMVPHAGSVASLPPRSESSRRVRRCVPPRQNCVLASPILSRLPPHVRAQRCPVPPHVRAQRCPLPQSLPSRLQTWCAVVNEVVLRSCAGYFLFHVNKVHRCAHTGAMMAYWVLPESS
jgi:hypothetical protein